MSLLPANVFPGALFLEARLLGQPCSIVSQVGLSIDTPECSVAVFSKASGVLLVAGVGSYCAYRICTKYLGQRFVWMLLESSRCDQLSSADRRLLYDCNENVEEEEDINEDRESIDDWREQVSISRPLSHISRSSRMRRSLARGLLALRHPPRPQQGVLNRRGTPSEASGRSVISSCSRSDRSASLRIVFEGGAQWDDEFDSGPSHAIRPSPHRRVHHISQSTHAQSIGDLCSVFDDVMSVVSGMDPCIEEQIGDTDTDAELDTTMQKCMRDSKYMYQSVIEGSECGSVVSGKSRRSRPSGLWQLTAEEPSTSQSTSMTDSGFSRSHNSRKSNITRSMFDSAIGADISSEDESVDMNRYGLGTVNEIDTLSQCISSASLEWCDDGFRLPANRIPSVADWDSELQRGAPLEVSIEHRPSESQDMLLFACQNLQPYSPEFKTIQHLYHRDRMKRIAIAKNYGADAQLAMFVASCRYHNVRPAMAQWPRLDKIMDKASCKTVAEEQALRHALIAIFEPTPEASISQSISALKTLLLLETAKICRLKKDSPKEYNWYSHDGQSTLECRLRNDEPLDETTWHLLTSATSISFEIFDVEYKSYRIGTASFSIPWLDTTNERLALFYVPDS